MSQNFEGTLSITVTKKGNQEFKANFVNARGKSVVSPILQQARAFDEKEAVDGDSIEVTMSASGQIARVTIKGKAVKEPVAKQAPKTAGHHKPVQSFARQGQGYGQANTRPSVKKQGMRATEANLPKATAPYNFIPQSKVVTVTAHESSVVRYSGEIICSLKALTPLLVSGNDGQPNEGDNAHKYFFKVNDIPTIPGTSLKGMLRSLVETMSFSAIAPVNDRKQFWRNIDDSVYYMEKMGRANIKKERDKVKQQAGYLVKEGADYRILPVTYDAVSVGSSKNPHKKRVTSGNMQKKSMDYDFASIGETSESLHVSDSIIEDFFLQLTPGQKSHVEKMYAIKELSRKSSLTYEKPLPVFYLPTEDGKVEFLGIPRYFRIPAKYTVASLRDKEMPRVESEMDFAQRLFGFTGKKSSIRGRVAVEAAFFAKESPTEVTKRVVLGQPHETCVAHYMQQELTAIHCMPKNSHRHDINTMSNYNTGGKLRGRKMYWHRDYTGEELCATNENKNVSSILHPLKAGAETQFSVHVHAVTLEELGALVEALFLPKDHAHKLGMGKSLGFGSVRIDIVHSNVCEDTILYGSVLARLEQKSAMEGQSVNSLFSLAREAFRTWVLSKENNATLASVLDFDALDTIRSLRKMMDYENRPKNTDTATMELKEFQQLRILKNAIEV